MIHYLMPNISADETVSDYFFDSVYPQNNSTYVFNDLELPLGYCHFGISSSLLHTGTVV